MKNNTKIENQNRSKTRNILVSLLAIACALALVATGVSAGTTEIVDIHKVEVKGIEDVFNENIAVEAGETIPVRVTLKNVGYNKLNELNVTVSMPALDVSRTVYSGDLEAIETNEEDDTVSVKVYLKVPYTAKAGVYSIQVDVTNEDLKETATKNIFVKNEFTSNVIVSDNRKSAEAGEDAVYELLVVNPTNYLKSYRFVVDSPSGVDTAISSSVVTMPAGSSKVVKVTANADSEGEYNIDVNVFAGENVVETANLELNVRRKGTGETLEKRVEKLESLEKRVVELEKGTSVLAKIIDFLSKMFGFSVNTEESETSQFFMFYYLCSSQQLNP